MVKNMTTGSPARLILLFMLPLMVGNMFQQFYNMADALIVGRTLGVQALAAVGCTGYLMFLIIGFAQGATAGMAIVTSQRFGAGEYAGVRRSFATSLVLCALLTVVLTTASVAGARPLLVLLRTPAEILDDAVLYTVIIMGGIAATMLFNLLSNIMRAVGNSRSPLWFLVFACVLNVVLDIALIVGAGLGVAGAAIATVAAQLVAGGLCWVYIWRKIPVLRLTRQDWRITATDLKIHLRLGLPMGFQMSIIAIGTLAVQFMLNGLGTAAVAAYTAGVKVDTFSSLPLQSFGVTIGTFTAQNYGAGQYARIRTGVRQCAGMSVAWALAMIVVNVLFGGVFCSWFVGSEPQIVGMAHQLLIISSSFFPLLSLLFIFRYTLQGLGHSLVPTLAGVAELVMRFFAAAVLVRAWGFTGICAAEPLAWLGALLPLTIAFARQMRSLRRTPDAPLPVPVSLPSGA